MKEIYSRLGLKADIDDEKEKFITRMKVVARTIYNKLPLEVDSLVINDVSFRLGKDIEEFEDFLEGASFTDTLLWCEAALTSLRIHHKPSFDHLRIRIHQAIEESVIDLGVRFDKEGKFYRKGAEELDQVLLIETLQWLKDFPVAKKSFEEALKEYLKKDFPDAITKCYSALESLTKDFLQSDKRLDKLVPELVSKLELSDQWKGILVHFCNYSHEFGSRHGKREKAEIEKPNLSEVEAYIYQTGLIMRLICQTKHKPRE